MGGMADQRESLFRAPVTPEEMKEAYKIPAPGANKFIITVGQPGVRIAFGEDHKDIELPVFYSAVTLHPIDAIYLYKILEEMLKDIEKQIIPVSIGNKDG